MSSRFFENYPKITYNGYTARNLLLRSEFFRNVLDDVSAFYPYVVKDGDRADIIANFYYGDWRYEWLVYLSNELMDPYYEWPLSQNNFDSFIEKKYGSMEISLDTIVHYVYNDSVDSSDVESMYRMGYEMSPDTYNQLSNLDKAFWTPVTAYEWEHQANEDRRSIKLLNNQLLKQVEKEMSGILNQ